MIFISGCSINSHVKKDENYKVVTYFPLKKAYSNSMSKENAEAWEKYLKEKYPHYKTEIIKADN